MRRIGIVADIHGNVPAMEAVLSDLWSQHVTEVLVGGDLVGRGPEGSKVVKRIRELGWRGVRGNHEDYLLGFRRRSVPEDWFRGEEWAASRWMAAELDDLDDRYIDELPFSIHAESVSDVCLVHGSPSSLNEGLGPWSSDSQLNRHLGDIEGAILVCGHTHRPMSRRVEQGWVVNVGAVGLPFNKDPRAQYAILHQGGERCEVEFRQVHYDVSETLRIYRSSGFLDEGGVTAQLLRLELQHASPFLVPFLKWSAASRVPVESSRLAPFLDFYRSCASMRDFFRGLHRLSGEDPES